jgi:mycothiol synthase
MSSSLPETFTLRPLRRDDLESLTDMLVAEERALRGESDWTRVDTDDWWSMLRELGEGFVAESLGGIRGVVGLVQRDDLFNSWIGVAPSRSDSGLAAQLLQKAEERTLARGGSRLHVDAFAKNNAMRDLLARCGYSENRRHYRMRIDFDEPPDEPAPPQGITIRTFDRERDAPGFHAAMNEAFEGQWGFRGIPFERWESFRLDTPDFDPSIWFVARDGDEVVGVLRGEAERWSCGWIAMVGVRPRWHRRGIGAALIRTAFSAFYDRGQPCVGLGVDTRNPTGATRLYERLGMRIVAEHVTYAKVLA